jgi:gas vesicle protein
MVMSKAEKIKMASLEKKLQTKAYDVMVAEIQAVDSDFDFDRLSGSEKQNLVDDCWQRADDAIQEAIDEWKENNMEECSECNEHFNTDDLCDCSVCGDKVCEDCKEDHKSNCDQFE